MVVSERRFLDEREERRRLPVHHRRADEDVVGDPAAEELDVALDVLAIAGLFVIRAAAGAEAVSVEISWWLLLCTALLALFLGLAKRRGELVLVGAARTPGRRVLEGYSIRLVDRLVSVVATATLLAYAAYTLTARDSKAMAVTIPFVLFAVGRYLVLVHRDDLREEPERVLLSDAQLLVAVAAWAVTAAVVLSVTQ